MLIGHLLFADVDWKIGGDDDDDKSNNKRELSTIWLKINSPHL